MSDSAATRRQLKIKAGVVKRFVVLHAVNYSVDTDSIPFPPATPRYQKELALYRTEVVDNERKLRSFTDTAAGTDEGGESWDVRNAVRVLPFPLPSPFAQMNECRNSAGESSAREREYGSGYCDAARESCRGA